MDRDERRNGRTSGCECLEDQCGIETRQRRTADIVANIDAADAERRRFPHHVDGEKLFLVPFQRKGRDFLSSEFASHVANRYLILSECELHVARFVLRQLVGIAKSAPSLTPDGQREVTVLVLV